MHVNQKLHVHVNSTQYDIKPVYKASCELVFTITIIDIIVSLQHESPGGTITKLFGR